MSSFIWFIIGGIVGFFIAGMFAAKRIDEARDSWNRFISQIMAQWKGSLDELRRAWDREHLGR